MFNNSVCFERGSISSKRSNSGLIAGADLAVPDGVTGVRNDGFALSLVQISRYPEGLAPHDNNISARRNTRPLVEKDAGVTCGAKECPLISNSFGKDWRWLSES
jgi:hypothetical protein